MNRHRYGKRLGVMDVTPTRRGVLIAAASASAAMVAMRTWAVGAAKQTALADADVLERGAAWLQGQQVSDGGYPNLRGEVAFGATSDAVNALVALRNAGIEVETEEAAAYLQEHAAAEVEALLGGAGRAAMAVAAAGADPSDVGGADLIELIGESWDEDAGVYGADLISNLYALLGLAAAGEEVPEEAIAALEATQLEDGGWSYDGTTGRRRGCGHDGLRGPNAGRRGEGRGRCGCGRGDRSFRTVQVDGGAFAFSPGAPPDANTTALIVCALTAAGEDLGGADWAGAVNALAAFQNESGAFRFTDQEPGDDIQVTTVALLALAGGALPVLPVE